MTKTLIQTMVLAGLMGGFWVSLSSKLDINSKASGDISSKLKDQVEDYREEATKAQKALLDHVDTTQGYVITVISQNSAIAEQNQKLLSSIDTLTQKVLTLTEQNTEMAKQNADLLKNIKAVNDNQTAILTAHTQTLQEAKTAAKKAQIDTSRALRAITKPTPKPWYQGIFSTPKR